MHGRPKMDRCVPVTKPLWAHGALRALRPLRLETFSVTLWLSACTGEPGGILETSGASHSGRSGHRQGAAQHTPPAAER